jgi:O-antigen/teichoic acid export membrane protein
MTDPGASGADTHRRFVRSTVAAYGSQLGRMALRFGADIVLARLILEEPYGLFDLALGAAVIGTVVRDAGLSYQLVRDERAPFGTVLAWNVVAGLVVTLALVIGAPFATVFDPALPSVLAGLAAYVFLEGLAKVPQVWFEKNLQVGRLVAPELLRSLVFAVVSITLASQGFQVWSLVTGELVGMAVLAAVLWWRARGEIPLAIDWRLLPDLLKRARYLFVIALGAFTLPHVERFVVAPFVTGAALGVYGRARLWSLRVQTVLVPAIQRVFYPTLVEYGDAPERSFPAYRLGTLAILTFEVLTAYFLFLNAETVFLTLLGPEWLEVVPLVKILCFLPLVDPLNRFGGEVLKARNDDRWWLVLILMNLASLIGFGILLSSDIGVAGIAWANFLLLGNLVMIWRVARVYGRHLWILAADLVYLYLAAAAPFVVVWFLFPEEGWPRFAASVVAGLAGAGLAALRFGRPFRVLFAGETP